MNQLCRRAGRTGLRRAGVVAAALGAAVSTALAPAWASPEPTAPGVHVVAAPAGVLTARGTVRLPAGARVARAGLVALRAGTALAAPLTGHVWGTAAEVPGTAALNRGGFAQFGAVSCASAGNCSAGGNYSSGGSFRAFVASQVNGTWHRAIEVPGALLRGGPAGVTSVACASAGNCVAGGDYDSSGYQQVFIASQVNGIWHPAIEVPGTAALNHGGYAGLFSVSCGAAGSCSAGGFYTPRFGKGGQAFVVSETHGIWHPAIEVPGTAALNRAGGALIASVSCAAAGSCSAGGSYTDGSARVQAFVVSQVNGTWHRAIEVPGAAVLNRGALAQIDAVSCASAGNCSAGGSYKDGSYHPQAFVIGQVNGAWRTAIEVPGTAGLNRGGDADIFSVSCASAGNCAADGNYADNSGHQQVFVVSQASGAWRTAAEVPGTAGLNRGGNADIASVSCGAAGNCVTGGSYRDSAGHQQAFVVSQASGAWHTAIEVPGTAALNRGGFAGIVSVSCVPAGICSAGGVYTDNSGHQQVFVDSKT